jgi:hypothetical protein
LSDWFAKPKLCFGDEFHYATIRRPFLDHKGRFEGWIVVHGHTPEYAIRRQEANIMAPGLHRIAGFRLGLDGGSYETGIVAGAEFRTGEYRIYLAAESTNLP